MGFCNQTVDFVWRDWFPLGMSTIIRSQFSLSREPLWHRTSALFCTTSYQVHNLHSLPPATHQDISARCQIAYLYRATNQADSQHTTYALHVTKDLLIPALVANYFSWHKEKPVVEWWISVYLWKERTEPPIFFLERQLLSWDEVLVAQEASQL